MKKENFIKEFNKASELNGEFSRLSALKYLRNLNIDKFDLTSYVGVLDSAIASDEDIAEYVYNSLGKDLQLVISQEVKEFSIIRCNNCNSHRSFTRAKGTLCSVGNCSGKVVGEEIVTTITKLYE